MQKKTTKYVKGSAREFKSGDISLDIHYEDAAQHVNERGYLKIIVSRRRVPDQYGNTHALKVNDYKPADAKPESSTPGRRVAATAKAAPKQPVKLAKPDYDQSDDLPF